MEHQDVNQEFDAAPGGGDALQFLSELRAALTKDEPPSVRPELLTDISRAIDQVMVEHDGLTQELLNAYEHLGVVFEVTRKLPEVHTESEIIDLFVENLRRSFEDRAVLVARRADSDGWMLGGRLASSSEWLSSLLDRAAASGSVIVEPCSEPTMPGSIAEMMVGPVFSGESLVCVIVFARARDAPQFRSSEMLLVESLATFCGDLIRNRRFVRELRETSIAMVRALVSAVDQKDRYTCGHSLRVAFYATRLGVRLDLTENDLQMLQWGALLHDVGKIGIREEVLNKRGRLTDAEFRHMREHPVRSYAVVQEVPQLAQALDAILYHHEHYDGSGYPERRKAEEIPLSARIVQVADVFDALTSDRSYRRAYTWDKALEILRDEAGKTVDPHLREVFDGLIREEVGGDPTAWERMFERANRFTQDEDLPSPGESQGAPVDSERIGS